jgi:hypothetical protein
MDGDAMSSTVSPLQALANAQAQEEGFNVHGSLPNTLNNPGDLEDSSGNLLQFATPESGMSALLSKLSNIASGNSTVYNPSESLAEFENTYTGGDPNAASNVASILGNGVTPQTPLSSILGASQSATPTASSSSATSGASTAASNAVSFLSSLFGGASSLDTSQYLIRGAAIAGGLILIAGAVFGFDKVQSTIITTAKRGSEAAALAA